MWKKIAITLPGLLLVLSGCNKVESTNSLNEESCDLCHQGTLSEQAVHRQHVSRLAMSNFPSRSEAANDLVKADLDTAFRLAMDSTDTVGRAKQVRLLGANLQCGECHQGVSHAGMKIDNDLHHNGKVDVVFDKAWLSEKFHTSDKTVHKAQTCDNIACHGAGFTGKEQVKWMTKATMGDTLSCNACHNVSNHKTGVRCDLCHFDVTHDGKTISNAKKHMNGVLDVW
jgi:predicted CxxxxCH...CXXCH cytochrome family protein